MASPLSYEEQLFCSVCKDVYCEVCRKQKKKVSCKCLTCDEYMCTDCESAHRGSKATRNHQIQAVIKLIKSQKFKMEETIEEIQKLATVLRRNFQALQKQGKNLVKTEQSQLELVDREVNALMTQLYEYRQEMKQKIKEMYSKLRNQLLTKVDVFEKTTQEAEEKIKFMQELLDGQESLNEYKSAEGVIYSVKEEVNKMQSQVPELQTGISRIIAPTVKVIVGDTFEPEKFIRLLAEREGTIDKEIMETVAIPSPRATALSKVAGDRRSKSAVALEPSDSLTNVQPDLYSSLLLSSYILVRETKPSSVIWNMCFINNELWCNVLDAIHIYNKDCVKLREISISGVLDGMIITESGQIIMAFLMKGLYQLDHLAGCQQQHKIIATGYYCSIAYYNQRLYALECTRKVIVEFKCENGNWMVTKEMALKHDGVGENDEIAAYVGGLYISALDNNTIYHYTMEGELLYQTGVTGKGSAGKLNAPCLCDVDEEGNVLVADSQNNRIQIYCTARREWHVLPIPGKLKKPKHILVDFQNKHLWISRINERILLKYSFSYSVM